MWIDVVAEISDVDLLVNAWKESTPHHVSLLFANNALYSKEKDLI